MIFLIIFSNICLSSDSLFQTPKKKRKRGKRIRSSTESPVPKSPKKTHIDPKYITPRVGKNQLTNEEHNGNFFIIS